MPCPSGLRPNRRALRCATGAAAARWRVSWAPEYSAAPAARPGARDAGALDISRAGPRIMTTEPSFSQFPRRSLASSSSRSRRAYGLHADPRAAVFRDKVRTWLKANLPQGLGGSACPGDSGHPPARGLRVHAGLAAPDVRGRLRRPHVAQGGRRPRPHVHGGDDPPRGDGAREGAARAQHPRHRHGGPDDHRLRHRRAEAALPAQDALVRGDLVPGLLRAERGLRPRLAADPRGEGRRALRGQRAEGVDLARPRLRLDDAARAHRSRRAQAQGHHLLPARHEEPRRHREAAQADHRRRRVQRGVLRQRPRPRVADPGRAQQRLGGRAHHADVRAARPRLRPPGAAADRARRPRRPGARTRRRTAGRRPRTRSSGRSSRSSGSTPRSSSTRARAPSPSSSRASCPAPRPRPAR